MWKLAAIVFLFHQALALWLERLGMKLVENDSIWGMPLPLFLFGIAAAMYLFYRNRTNFVANGFGAALVVGSMASNLFERVAFGGVLDWFWLGDWVINSADAGICIGVFLWVFRGKYGAKKEG